MKLMINASEPNYGVVEDFMIMDSEPVIGKWSVSVKAHNMVSIHWVETYTGYCSKMSRCLH